MYVCFFVNIALALCIILTVGVVAPCVCLFRLRFVFLCLVLSTFNRLSIDTRRMFERFQWCIDRYATDARTILGYGR